MKKYEKHEQKKHEKVWKGMKKYLLWNVHVRDMKWTDFHRKSTDFHRKSREIHKKSIEINTNPKENNRNPFEITRSPKEMNSRIEKYILD